MKYIGFIIIFMTASLLVAGCGTESIPTSVTATKTSMITATLTSTFTPAPTSTFTPVLTPTQNVTTLTDEEIVQRYFPDAEYHLQGDRVIILDLVLAQITSLSPEIRQLKRLGILYLQGNPITTLPPELERWRPNH